ncbi:MAG: A/G-specific adenine glycosylase [Actinomycetota bacterium]
MARARVEIGKIHRRVLGWFDEHGRSFPWRAHRDPYQTLVAELMLQQTQTARVAPVYVEFLKRFPTVERLARAPAMEVIQAWKGLGYNRRAVDLQRAAQTILHEYGGEVPDDPGRLRKLPGVGEYSASAVACFAYDVQTPVIDVNVTRVLSRAALGRDDGDVRVVAEGWLPAGSAYHWNQALMDIGATLCRNDKPLCPACPMKSTCAFYAKGKHKQARVRTEPKQPKFEGSARQKRGSIIDRLRVAAGDGISLGALGKAIHPEGADRDLSWLVELLEGLERDGLATMSPSARRGVARGTVRLPR